MPRNTLSEFTTEEVDALALGWHEAFLMSRIEDSPVDTGDIVVLDLLTHRADGVLSETVEQSIQALEKCSEFFEPYFVGADLDRDSPEFLNIIYPMQQNSEMIRLRFRRAIDVLKSKL